MNYFDRATISFARTMVIGMFFVQKYRNQMESTDISRTAKALRKQGVPCEVAVRLLAYKY